MRKRAALYIRCSTMEQSTETQELQLREVAERSGWDVVRVYRDQGISGSKGRADRPQFDQLLKDATKRKYYVVMAWAVDRLGRSLQDLIEFLNEIHSLKVGLFVHQQALDTTTSSGRAMFQLLGVFAELERAIIVERVRAGIAGARARGKRLGQPPGSKTKPDVETKIRTLLGQGVGIVRVGKLVGVGTSTVQRVRGQSARDSPGNPAG